ncbi:unnamed protein product [Eruca vesicaria subsp. sativa]|uniref:Uncharacterized protein n=1 Tax=Eruca vesicaria subsp. sativa TaxID=29727 RepID=A0ABC8MAP0_ERUVS|nr:unnamed protein product [Eruca vesicaria subsp. sativa]
MNKNIAVYLITFLVIEEIIIRHQATSGKAINKALNYINNCQGVSNAISLENGILIVRGEGMDEAKIRRKITANQHLLLLRYSNSTSSDSSRFSSSESDSFFLRSKPSSSPPPHTRQPNPIRSSAIEKPSSKQEHGGFLRTKSKALKIYTDLTKTSNHKKLKKINTTVSSSAEQQPPPQSSSNTTCSSTNL